LKTSRRDNQGTQKRQGTRKRLFAVGTAIVLVGAGALVVRHRRQAEAPGSHAYEEPSPEVQRDRWHGFEAGFDAPAPAPGGGAPSPGHSDPASKAVTPGQVASAMAEWREAILQKRAEQVIQLDQAFSLLPGRYGPELVRMAETDSDERVRAFCTRVLGKMKNPALVEDFQRMLADKSPFVRQNAAWALGELARRPGGKEAALAALDELQQAEGDSVTEVRTAATNALKALQ
jgi:hypothetical protein